VYETAVPVVTPAPTPKRVNATGAAQPFKQNKISPDNRNVLIDFRSIVIIQNTDMIASYFQPSQNTGSKAESNRALLRLMIFVQMGDYP
jgi:hypothetical protein